MTTQIFDRIDPYRASDAVFAVKDSPICDFARHKTPDAEASRVGIAGPCCTAEFDFRLCRGSIDNPALLAGERPAPKARKVGADHDGQRETQVK